MTNQVLKRRRESVETNEKPTEREIGICESPFMKKSSKHTQSLVAERSISYADARRICEEKITLGNLQNDRYSSQNRLGRMVQLVQEAKRRGQASGKQRETGI